MISRRLMLALSFLSAAALYGGVYVASPEIYILRARATAKEIASRFNVKLYDDVNRVARENSEAGIEEMGASPASVEQLFSDDIARLEEEDTSLAELAEIPSLSDRVAREALQREHDLEIDDSILRKIDAKILEITQDAARENIQVARRLVKPSSERLVQPGEYPVLRGEGGAFGGGTLRLDTLNDPLQSSLLSAIIAPVEPPLIDESETETEDGEPLVLEPLEPTLPDLPIETLVARLPLQNEIREESPYEFIDDLVNIELDAYAEPGTTTGFFRLRILPKESETLRVLPKQVTFVVDASRSINQRKLSLTVRGVNRCIALLHREDHFNIVVFRDNSTMFRPQLVAATAEAKGAAVEFLEALESRGETDVYSSVRPVIQDPVASGVARVIFFVSDGRATSGVVDGREIINGLTAENVTRNTIFTFGGGRTVNRYLLDLLAYRNKGQSLITPRIESIDEELPRFFNRISDPFLVNLSVDYGRIDDSQVFPKEVPDFYRGRVVTLYGRYDINRDRDFVMRLSGNAGVNQKEVIFKADLRNATTGDATVARDWAFEKTYFLIGEIGRLGERPELINEVLRLSEQYDIRSSYSP